MTGRAVVTGGSGKLGRAVIDELRACGWRVVNIDRVRHPDPNVPTVIADLTDLGQVYEAINAVDSRFRKVDALIHLAAIPGPGLRTNSSTFLDNLTTTFNLFAAAARSGVNKVVWASSETLLGIPFDVPPPYLPVDEKCPSRPESSYSLAKHLEETMAAEFARWNPALSITGLRLSNVLDESDYRTFDEFQSDSAKRRWNLWSYIDSRDGARAVRLALEASLPGFETFIIANSDTVMHRGTLDLVREQFPEVPINRELGENQSLLCIDKARGSLGFEPEFGWRAVKIPADQVNMVELS